MSETSQLQESIDSSLLDKTNTFTIRIVDSYNDQFLLEKEVKVENPFKFHLGDFVPADQKMDLPAFIDLVGALIMHQNSQDSSELSLDFKEHYTDEMFTDDRITWAVIERCPAKMNPKATGRPQRKPLYSYDLHSPEYPNKVVIVESMPIDHIIEFSACSKNAKQANDRALWLEKLLINQGWVFQSKGVEKFYWEKRLADNFMNVSGQRVHVRALRFFVRLREYRPLIQPMIKHFDFNLTVS